MKIVFQTQIREDYQSSFEMANGQIIPYAELPNWIEAYAA